jgi:Zn finger protein HypA/HybF involved in hydrogenase expression
MTKVPYTTRKGQKLFKPATTLKNLERKIFNGGTGWCVGCGTEAEGVEPDARQYTCEKCHAPKVYGLEELMMRGLVAVR